jgi:hypothetical protein
MQVVETSEQENHFNAPFLSYAAKCILPFRLVTMSTGLDAFTTSFGSLLIA